MCAGGPGYLSNGFRYDFGGGYPCASINYYPAHLAIIGDKIETYFAAFFPNLITPRFIATAWPARGGQFDLVTCYFPVATQRRPASALKFEGSARIELSLERTELQRLRGEFERCFLCDDRKQTGRDADTKRDIGERVLRLNVIHDICSGTSSQFFEVA